MLKAASEETISFFERNRSDIEGAIGSSLTTLFCAAEAVVKPSVVSVGGASLFALFAGAYINSLWQNRPH